MIDLRISWIAGTIFDTVHIATNPWPMFAAEWTAFMLLGDTRGIQSRTRT